MEYRKFEMNGYNLYTAFTDKFKTISMRINIRVDDKKENEKYFPMLWRMLVSTSSNYDSIRDINKACAEIYDPSYSITSIGSGSEEILSLSASFTNEKYTEAGMNEKNIKFLSEFVFNPKIVDGAFDKDVFEVKREKLIEGYLSIKDFPRDYADSRLDEEMITLDYKNNSLDEVLAYTRELTSEELYDFYKKIIKEGKIDIFICGNFDELEMKDIFERNISIDNNVKSNPNHIVRQKEYNKEPNIIIEDSDSVQSNLVIGCKCMNVTDIERMYVSILYCWILGGGMNSLLNQSVREKNSLCYYIHAIRKNLIDVVKISAGINGEDFEKAFELIKDEMENMKNGNFSDELFEGVKNIYYNSLIGTEDYQNSLIGSFVSQIYIGADDLETRRKVMEKITKEDVMEYAKKVHIDTVFLLKGVSK